MKFKHQPILVKGDEKLACSIAVCLTVAGHPVTLHTERKDAPDLIGTHLADIRKRYPEKGDDPEVEIISRVEGTLNNPIAIVVNREDLEAKRSAIRQLESILPGDAVIGINTESIALSEIQAGATRPERIIGLNWVEPAHTTFFLEIISNQNNPGDLAENVSSLAGKYWQKDPYILTHDIGIRSRMIAAMVREAFYLLENGYVSIEDVDRACRNDAGYYLPFAGHCRYMDLMGTYIYGKVMEGLNPELSKDTGIPEFFVEIIRRGGEGLENGQGFYVYEAGEAEKRIREFRKFSYEIREIIARYPFRHEVENSLLKKKISSGV